MLTTEGRRKRQAAFKAKVQERRLALLLELGPCCAVCGDTKMEPAFHFDHVDGWKPQPTKKPNQLVRINTLWRDYVNWREYRIGGPIRVLCAKCNGWDGRKRQLGKRR